jgi:hypothetical protein
VVLSKYCRCIVKRPPAAVLAIDDVTDPFGAPNAVEPRRSESRIGMTTAFAFQRGAIQRALALCAH